LLPSFIFLFFLSPFFFLSFFYVFLILVFFYLVFPFMFLLTCHSHRNDSIIYPVFFYVSFQ
jgi:hypothetical protein